MCAWYILILTPNLSANISKYNPPAKIYSWIILIIRCTYVISPKWSNMSWAPPMRALVSLPDNFGTTPIWYDWIWSTETEAPGLLSIYFLMDPYLFHFFLHWLLFAVPNMHDTQGGKSELTSINIDWMNPSFASISMDLGWRWYNLSCQDFNSCFKGDKTSGNVIF